MRGSKARQLRLIARLQPNTRGHVIYNDEVVKKVPIQTGFKSDGKPEYTPMERTRRTLNPFCVRAVYQDMKRGG